MHLPIIILLRHGETEWNVEGRYQGQLNSPLTKLGEAQAKRNAMKIKPYLATLDGFRFLSSPMGRAKETALIVADTLAISQDKIEFVDAIKEFNYGKFEGRTKAFCLEHYREEYEAREADKWDYLIEGGESYGMVTERLNGWLMTLRGDEVIVMVAHEMVNRALRGIYSNFPKEKILKLRQPNDMVIKLENRSETVVT